MIEVLAYGIAAALTAVCVIIHYAAMRWLLRSPRLDGHATGVMVVVLAMFVVHVAEIWIFALGYFVMSGTVFGTVSASSFLDCVYFSASAYTTLGLGDLYPAGPLRAVTGTEGLSGLILIAWTASFTFLQMQRLWERTEP